MFELIDLGPLKDVGLELTTNCNLQCVHCWQGDKKQSKTLSLSDAITVLRRLAEIGVTSLRITGGEPMIHPRFWDIMSEASRRGFSIILRTNGTLIDKATAYRLQQFPISFVEISIDGFASAIHDRFRRREGSLQRSLLALKFLLERKIQARVKTVIGKSNIHNLLELGRLLLKDCSEIEMWSLVDLVPLGNTVQYFQDLMPKPVDMIAAMRSLESWIKCEDVPFRVSGSALQLVTGSKEAIMLNKELKYPCSYRSGYLYICADRSVKRCAWLGGSLGNIPDDLGKMWQSDLCRQKVSVPVECERCRYFELGLCGYLYYICPGAPCFPERKEFFKLLVDSSQDEFSP